MADQLEQTTASLRKDADSLAKQMRNMPLPELDRLIPALSFSADHIAKSENPLPAVATLSLKLSDDFNVSLSEFLEQQVSVSTRLHNAIRWATDEGACPFASVAEYILAGDEGALRLRKLPSLGSTSAAEFDRLVKGALATGSIVPAIRQRNAVIGGSFPNVRSLVDTVFAALNSVEQTVILARLQDKQTLAQVGVELNLTRERVRQIEARALRRISPAYNVMLQECAVAIHRVLCEIGRNELTLAEFARMGSCSTLDVLFFLELLRKANLKEAELFGSADAHAYLKNQFIDREDWDEAIRDSLMSAQWPVGFSQLINNSRLVPQFYVIDHLCRNYGAEMDGCEFKTLPRLSTHDMCIGALLNATGPTHLTDLRALIFRSFGRDLAEPTIAAHVGRSKEAAICGPGTYVHYKNIPYTEQLLEQVRYAVFTYLQEQGNFISSKVIFERLFVPKVQMYPSDFNHYLMMGIVQDDERFLTKRGNMVGLSSFDLDETYISLEDEVRNLVLDQGPISIPEIIANLSATRKLCNDTGIRLILSQTPSVVRVGPRTFDSIHRFFRNTSDFEDYVLAIKISLMVRAKGNYAVAEDLTALGLSQATPYVVESLLNVIEHTTIHGTHSLAKLDNELSTYKTIADDCLTEGASREELVRRLQGIDLRAEKLTRLDRRFCPLGNAAEPIVPGSELRSILYEFGF
jgi:RNA polymerase primary sigma factor